MTISEAACVHATSLPSLIAHSVRRVAQVDKDDATRFFLRAFFCLKLAGWICAAWAVLGPWCKIYLALGLEQGLLVEFPKGSAAIEVSFFQSQA